MLPRHQEGEPHLGFGRHLQEEGIFPVGSLVSWIQSKENQEKPLLPARSREVCWVVACGQRLPQVSDPSSLGVVQEGASAVAADRFEAASDLLLKRPCFLPPIHFFLAPWFPLSTQGLGVSCSLGTPRPPLPEVHQDRLCGVRIKDTCCAHREEGEHGILQWRVPKLSRSV